MHCNVYILRDARTPVLAVLCYVLCLTLRWKRRRRRRRRRRR
eukprot:COSAG05_NODE_5230_length_1230_cov_10.731211_1_plen_41_part_10